MGDLDECVGKRTCNVTQRNAMQCNVLSPGIQCRISKEYGVNTAKCPFLGFDQIGARISKHSALG